MAAADPGRSARRASGAPIRPTPVIHVVDDDEQLRIALLRLLNAAGFEARGYAATGEFQ